MRRTLSVFLAAGCVFVSAIRLEAQLSPGPLSRAHSNMEGPLSCGNCHKFGMGRPELKCSSCHVEIQKSVAEKRGYHSRIVDTSKGDIDCSRCHAEHAGRDFALIRWPEPQASFNHGGQTGFALEGKHASLACAQCHTPKNIAESRRSGIMLKDLNRTFLGLDKACLSCHKDEHQGQLSTTCTNCHSQSSWKPVTQFNHDATRFRLTGRHSTVMCEACHPLSGSNGARKFRNVAFADCTDCHRDPHAGKFAETCTQCHSTAGWRDFTLVSNRFNHNQTRYPLRGAHAKVVCAACHKNSDFSKPVASAKCTDCHADRHNGQFLARIDRGDCQSCHSLNGFKPAAFTLDQHAKTKYPLVAKHAQVACEKCHEPKGERTNYHPAASTCLNCHKDAHDKQFLEPPFSNRCESCHSLSGFKRSTFTAMRHGETQFPLGGAHAAIACIDCHQAKQASVDRQYRLADKSCRSCHRDPHGSAAEVQSGCESCHTDRVWSQTLAFDHNKAGFPLVGAHQTTPCLACHKVNVAADQTRTIPFHGAARACGGCHDDVHAGQFRKANATDCSTCHESKAWRPSLFNHEKTRFPLTGSHRAVRCQSCHETEQVEGRRVLIYTKAKRECASCH